MNYWRGSPNPKRVINRSSFRQKPESRESNDTWGQSKNIQELTSNTCCASIFTLTPSIGPKYHKYSDITGLFFEGVVIVRRQ